MPSAKPQKNLRAPAEKLEAWDAAAKRDGQTFNAWATRVLDAAASGVAAAVSPATPAAASSSGPSSGRDARAGRTSRDAGLCPRRRFHRRGTFCKSCGVTPT